MRHTRRSTFHPTPIVRATAMLVAALGMASTAHAGPGFGDAVDLNKAPFIVQSYFANSPAGARQWDPLTGAPVGYDPANAAAYKSAVDALFPAGYPGTGKALRKFVDPLPLPGKMQKLADGVTDKTIPVAVKSKWVNPKGVVTNDDYYEIAVVEYAEKFHSDLKKATTLRGYVQIDHLATNGLGALPGSKQVALTYPDGSPIMVNKTDASGKLLKDAGGQFIKVQALAVEKPFYLGPVIAATSTTYSVNGAPTRLKFLNLLPVGRAETVATTYKEFDRVTGTWVDVPVQGVTKRNGDLFLPVDPSVAGAGYGPDGVHTYPQNRALIHLHGGDNPWISDGTPHQWITPAGEQDPAVIGSVAADPTMDPTLVEHYTRGVGALNVPDMNDPGPGAMTYYFPNGQSARLEWYHDHSVGLTRLNVYAGMASAYLLTDDKEQELIAQGVLPGADATIPLVIQDKTFVPDDIALQDGRWSTTGWGAPGDMWYPHVYETVQDPNQDTNFNAVGRWHWGPWFWPVFPALYNLPTGIYGDVTLTPEAWMDTPIVNGVAYPTLTVEPKPYRFRILNASNDRTFTFNLFKADPGVVTDDGRTGTEVKMVPVQNWANLCAPGVTKSDGVCTPETWTTDIAGHAGGVPDPTTQGPTLYQIASEGGLLPGLAKKDATPINYILDKGRAVVLNVDYGMSGLHLSNAERADVVVDFSQYAGQTLIVYNDSGAPVPAADPRNEYFTAYGDQSATGGAEDTRTGYGPNSRTIMQIKVAPAVTTPGIAPIEGVAAAEANLDRKIKDAYAVVQEPPVVAQSAYNDALGKTWNDTKAFSTIFTGSLKQPTFDFVPGTEGAPFNSVKVSNLGSGYLRLPSVSMAAPHAAPLPGDETATAQAAMKIDKLHIINPGSGYKIAPVVTITSAGPGAGATATATLKVTGVQLTAGGTGYTSAPTVTFAKPTTPGGVQATGTATIAGGAVTGITITNPGTGYASAPAVSFSGGGGTGAKATTTGSLDALTLNAPDPNNPGSAGGGGYTDLSTAATEPGNPTPGLIINVTAPPAGGVAPAVGASGKVFDITLIAPGAGYTAATLPGVTIAPPVPNAVLDGLAGTPQAVSYTTALAAVDTAGGGAPQGSILVKPKAIQELFDPTFGRLNATLGVEIPYTSALTQTTIPLGYVDAPTEEFSHGETQIWKITHNGVDTHPVHFHLLNVQLINRVGWDNFIAPPEPNELGWKETVKMAPLEDVIVAVRAKRPKLGGFGLPNSVRLLDPAQPEGAMTGFTQIDPNTGNPASMANGMFDFGWEYVWHCHILGHEENDFMRAVVFHAKEAVPLAPTGLAAVLGPDGVQLNWTDNAVTEYKFDIQRADVQPDGATLGAWQSVGTMLANGDAYLDATVAGGVNASGGTSLVYKVVAVGAAGTAESNVVNVALPAVVPVAPNLMAAAAQSGTQITVTWQDVANNESNYVLQRTVGGVTTTFTLAANAQQYVDTGLPLDTLVSYSLTATNVAGSSAAVTTSAYTMGVPAMTSLTATADSASQVTLNWASAAPVNNQAVTGYTITRTGGAGAPVTTTAPAGATSQVDGTVSGNTTYTYTVSPVNANSVPPLVGAPATASATTPLPVVVVNAPTALAATVQVAQGRIALSWTDNATNEASFAVQRSADGVNFAQVGTAAALAGTGTVAFNDTTVVAGATYFYRVVAVNVTAGVATPSLPSNVVQVTYVLATPTNLAAAIASTTRVTLNWTDTSVGEASFAVWRSTNGGAPVQIGTVARTAAQGAATGGNVTFNNNNSAATPLVLGQTYTYHVTAVNGAVVSAPSAVATVTFAAPAAPAVPTYTVTRQLLTDTVTLNWQAVPGATSYTVQRVAPNGTVSTVVNNTTQLTVTQALVLRNANPYVYRVRANNALGNSAYTPVSILVN